MIEHVFITRFFMNSLRESATPVQLNLRIAQDGDPAWFDLADYFGVAKRALEGRKT